MIAFLCGLMTRGETRPCSLMTAPDAFFSARILPHIETGVAQVPAAQALSGFSFSPRKAFERRPVLPLTTARSGSSTPLPTPCTGFVQHGWVKVHDPNVGSLPNGCNNDRSLLQWRRLEGEAPMSRTLVVIVGVIAFGGTQHFGIYNASGRSITGRKRQPR